MLKHLTHTEGGMTGLSCHAFGEQKRVFFERKKVHLCMTSVRKTPFDFF